VEIVGLDLAESMLALCREQLAGEAADVQARVQLVHADMRDFDLGRAFTLITMPFRGFLHLQTVEDQLACLAAARRHLAGDGRLIVDIFNPSLKYLVLDSFLDEFGDEPEFAMPDGRKVVRRHRLSTRDPFTQVNRGEIIYHVTHPDGHSERLVHNYHMRYLFRYEAEHLLARAGFEVEHLYADYDKSAYGSIDPGELIFVARKT
jgi:SAM-dependent methyltransferase